MSDIIKNYFAKSTEKEKERRLKFLYDNGSPWTFVKRNVALKMRAVSELPEPYPFYGFGDGRFFGTHILQLQIKLKGLWVPHLCYVVSDEVLDKEYDVLVGHDFMQRYDVGVYPKKKKVIISKDALRRGMRIKKIIGKILI